MSKHKSHFSSLSNITHPTIARSSAFTVSVTFVFFQVAAWRIATLLERKQVAASDKRLYFKAAVATACLILETVLAAQLSTHAGDYAFHETFLVAGLSVLASLAIPPMTALEHLKSERPSTCLTLYLVTSIGTNAATTINFVRHSSPIFVVTFWACIASKLILLLLETGLGRTIRFHQNGRICSETRSGIIGRSLYWWVTPLIKRGYHATLRSADLPNLDSQLETKGIAGRFEKISRLNPKKRRLPTAILITLKWPLVMPVIPRAMLVGLTIYQPLLIQQLVQYLEEGSTGAGERDGTRLAIMYVAVYIGIALSTALYYRAVWRFNVMVRGCLMWKIFTKSLALPLHSANEAEPLTLMGSDIERIGLALRTFHDAWANAVQVLLATYLLHQCLGMATAAPLALALGLAIAATKIAGAAGRRQLGWLSALQRRISATAELIRLLKVARMLALDGRATAEVQELRLQELNQAARYRYATTCADAIGYAPLLFCPLAAFSAFVLFANKTDDGLDAVKIFTSYSLILHITSPLGTLLRSLPRLSSAYECLKRVEDFLTREEHTGRHTRVRATEKHTMRAAPAAVSLTDVTIAWSTKASPALRNLTFEIPQNTITMIVGPAGSGKSTLLKVVLGEIPCIHGHANANIARIGICDQEPWLYEGTIRDNIQGFCAFSLGWYNTVVAACGVAEMLSALPLNDLSMVGVGGSRLSGGQRLRVALARAVYHQPQLLVLDDVFSGLDSELSSKVATRLLGHKGLLRRCKMTVLMATHAVHYLGFADNIIELSSHGLIMRAGAAQLTAHDCSQDVKSSTSQFGSSLQASEPALGSEALDSTLLAGSESFRRRSTSTWLYYVRAAGYDRVAGFFAAELIYAACSVASQLVLKAWSDASEAKHEQISKYAFWLASVQILAMLSLVGGTACGAILIVTKAGNTIHKRLSDTAGSLSLSHLTALSPGDLLNRFSQDLQLIDVELPVALVNVTTCAFLFLGQLVVIVMASPWILVALPVLAGVLVLLQRYYVRTSRQLRRLDLDARAPLLSHLQETIKGLTTIRAMHGQDHLTQRAEALIDASQRPTYLLLSLQQWLTLVLDLISAGLAALLVCLAIALRDWRPTDPALYAAAMVSLMSMNTLLAEVSNYWAHLETSLESVARVQEFTEDRSSRETVVHAHSIDRFWPRKGAIKFTEVTVTYGFGRPPVLREMSFTVPARTRIGICGPSGSGKSSLVLTLLRLLDPSNGQVIVDGSDLGRMSRSTVCERLNVITQEPLIMSGTVRENVDPHSRANHDHGLIELLQKVGLWGQIQGAGGLQALMTALKLSLGQQQLLCLARAMLRKTNILILDEATSSLDAETEGMVTDIIDQHFAGCTILAVAHRLHTILDFDRVLVLDKGRIMEDGRPRSLLASPGSAFARLFAATREHQ